MPIRPENRWLYPIDWPQLSDMIRFGRAKGCCASAATCCTTALSICGNAGLPTAFAEPSGTCSWDPIRFDTEIMRCVKGLPSLQDIAARIQLNQRSHPCWSSR